MTRLALVLIALASSASAQSFNDWGGTASVIRITPPDQDHKGARAQVTFHNEMVHGPDDNGCFPLALDDFVVTVCFEWNVETIPGEKPQAERATVIPPDGYTAAPPSITVDEGATDTLWIYGAIS